MKYILCAIVAAVFATAQSEESDSHAHRHAAVQNHDLRFVNAVLRQPPPGAAVVAGFLDIINDGDDDDLLLSLSADFATNGEIHQTHDDDGVMRMRPLPQGLTVEAHSRVVLQSGGLHLMLFGVNDINPDGEDIVLNFARQGAVTVRFAVGAPSAHQH